MNTKEIWVERFGKLAFVAEGVDSIVYRFKDGSKEKVLRIYKNKDLTCSQVTLYRDLTNKSVDLLQYKPETVGGLPIKALPIIEIVVIDGQIATISEYVSGKNLQDVKVSISRQDLAVKAALLSLGIGDMEMLTNLDSISRRMSEVLGCVGISLELVNIKPVLKDRKPVELLITDLCGSIGRLGLPEIKFRR